MDIVINYDPTKKEYKIYEPSTDTVLVSTNLTEGIVNLDIFLKSQGLIQEDSDILLSENIDYHMDSYTMRAMVESNVNLLKRLRSGQSEFKNSSNKFGLSNAATSNIKNTIKNKLDQKTSDFSKGSKNFSKGNFSGTMGSFGKSSGKFGSNGLGGLKNKKY